MERYWRAISAALEINNMRVVRGLAAFLLGSTFLGLSLGAAQAITLTFGGGPVTTPPFPGYGATVDKNNVVNSPLSGNSVTDPSPSPGGGTMIGTVGSNHAVATVGGAPAGGYKVDWYFIGAESGYDITLNVPTLAPYTEHNQNNQCTISCSGLHGPQIDPQYLGTTANLVTETVLNFSLHATSSLGTIDHGTLANGTGNPAPGGHPTSTSTAANLVFSYAKFLGSGDGTATGETVGTASSKTWELTGSATADLAGGIWFLFAFNDTGGPDDNHDDFVGMARVYALTAPGGGNTPVPVPGAFLLMGTVLAGAGGVGAWRRRRSRTAIA